MTTNQKKTLIVAFLPKPNLGAYTVHGLLFHLMAPLIKIFVFCIERDTQYLKFGLVFDLNFFHHLDLYQVNKTLLELTFTLFFLFTVFNNFVNFEEITI